MHNIDASQVESLANFRGLCSELKRAFQAGDQVRALCPEKSVLGPCANDALFLTMPSLDPKRGIFAVKIGAFYPREPNDPRPTIHATVMVWCANTGVPLAQIDGAALTAIKCAAVSAVVTDHCARPDARTLAIIGSGVQAAQQVRAVCSVRPIRQVRLAGRTLEHVQRFATTIKRQHPTWGVSVHHDIEEAIADADIIATTTSSHRPLSVFANVGDAVHFNCMGGHDVDGRELPLTLLEKCHLIVEDRPTAVREAGVVHERAYDLTNLFAPGAPDMQQEMTVFSSTGHAFLDLLTATHLLTQAGIIPAEKSADRQPTTA